MPLESTINGFFIALAIFGSVSSRVWDAVQYTRQDNANRQSTRPDDDVDPRIVSKRDEDIGIVVQKMIVLHFRSSA